MKNDQNSPHKVTKLTPLHSHDPRYLEIHDRFVTALPEATVRNIISIEMPQKITKRHLKLKEKMGKKGDFTKITHSMFHGTSYICDGPNPIIAGKNPLCKLKNCAMCGILKNGNKRSKSARACLSRTGIWTSNDPAYSLHFSLRYRDRSPLIMFALDVLSPHPGYTLEVFKDAATLPRFLIIFDWSKPMLSYFP
ncbi:hypothetical protein G9A89_012588 [Geosiphon pyriformis]|nr:hypothetical protein G9A89_012588 [Geosiphon pyriformis]